MKKCFTGIILIVFVILTSSCSVQSNGDTLKGFTHRINKLYDTYEISENGYIFDQKNNTLSRFYKFSENEILLQFKTNNKNLLSEMNIVFTENLVEASDEFNFIKNCISAYIDDQETENHIFEDKSLYELLKTQSNDTIERKSGDTQFLLDVTDYGTVITVVKNNL